ncbi:hypothetical protein HGRIS_006381 [Hohenbuehelia grisea]|uniref:DUF4246 domain-containing protein n=1 Tax=Hohenbuehelia grisea TaxID=104357 RepID=A0ABR3K2R4_9AGAR
MCAILSLQIQFPHIFTTDPFVAQETPVHEGVKNPPLTDGKFSTTVVHALADSLYPDPIIHKSKCAWIPSIFKVSDDGKSARIESYINGLGPREDFPDMYRIIEELFVTALPHFERTTKCELQRGTRHQVTLIQT